MVSEKQHTEKGHMTDMPMRVVFTDAGVRYFKKQGHTFRRFTLTDEREEYGIQLVNFDPKLVQKMVNAGFVRKIECPMRNPSDHRADLMDIAKLLCYAMLYDQCGEDAYQQLLGTRMVADWNRRMPRLAVTAESRLDSGAVRSLLAKDPQLIASIQRSVREPVNNWIDDRDDIADSDRFRLRTTVDRFLRSMSPVVWLLLAKYRDWNDAEAFRQWLVAHLKRYIDRTSIADYLAILVAEIVVHLYITSGTAGTGGDPVYVLWDVRRPRHIPNDHGRLATVVSNSTAEFQAVRSDMIERTKRSMSQSVDEFYRSASRGDFAGLYYLTFMQDACEHFGLHYESYATESQQEPGRALVNLILGF